MSCASSGSANHGVKPGLSRSLLFLGAMVGCNVSSPELSQSRQADMVCAGPATLKGLDVAHYDGDIDWAEAVSDGNAFAFAKATEGTTFVDPKFAQNWADMKTSGIVRGAYHFFHANDDPIVQADFFLSTVGTIEQGDMPVTLDLEVDDGESATTITQKAIVWLDYVAMKTGKKPILYTSKRVVTEYLGNAMGLDDHAVLWDAQWNVTCPDLPDTYATWAFWQSTDVGTVPGLPTPNSVDIDTFNGDLAALHALGVTPGGSTTSSSTGGESSAATTNSVSASSATNGGPDGASGGEGGGSASGDSSSGCSCEMKKDSSRAPVGIVGVLALFLTGVRRRAHTKARVRP